MNRGYSEGYADSENFEMFQPSEKLKDDFIAN
jgi:hypothetical protein